MSTPTLLIQTNVVDRFAMRSLANMADILKLEVATFENHEGIFYQNGNEVDLKLTEHLTYLPFTSVPTFKLMKDQKNVLSYSLDKFNTEDFIHIFGAENMLNPKPWIGHARDIPWEGEELFVRPYSADKTFNGGVYSKYSSGPVGLCAVSKRAKITSETRFFISKNEIIGASTYIVNGQAYLSSSVQTKIYDFVNEQIEKFDAVERYVMDVATTPDGIKIIELNTFNTSGIYKIDLFKFLAAIKQNR